jgi:predicted secreted acid phosphatase
MGATMRKIYGVLCLGVFALCSSNAHADWSCRPEDQANHTLDAPAADRPGIYNIGQLKSKLRDYRYCGQYDQDVTASLQEAEDYIAKHAADPDTRKPAVVLDIDETSLSNWLEIEADDFGFIAAGGCDLQTGVACGDTAWESQALGDPIKPTLKLFNKARSLGVEVFFVTGRRDRADLRAATIKNLEQAGYSGWKELRMRPIASVGPVSAFKTSVRHEINQTFRIIANIGDQESDLDGGKEAEQRFRVPNPFYFIP